MDYAALLKRYRVQITFLVLSIGALWVIATVPSVSWEDREISWHALLPPFVALSLVLVTRRVVLSLALGLLVGSFALHGPTDGVLIGAKKHVYESVIDPFHLYIAGFALTVLGMVKLAELSGGTPALVRSAQRYLKSARSTRLGTFVLGLLIFFDDYANTMLVGPSMRPLTDRFGISREKLAYLVDSTAAPVAGIAVVSTWLGYEVGLLTDATKDLAVEGGGYALLLQALPLRFYCIFALGFVFLNAVTGRDFGPMLRFERAKKANPSSLPLHPKELNLEGPRGLLSKHLWLNALLPIGTLIGAVFLGLVQDGGGFSRLAEGGTIFSFSFWRETLSSAEHSDLVLFSSGLLAAAVAFAMSLISGQLSTKGAFQAFGKGLKTGMIPMGILICAWGLGSVCKDLGTGPFLVLQLKDILSPELIPLVAFFSAAIAALATGTSWGTMAILIPAAVPLAQSVGGMALMLPTIAAVLDGAIFGDHCSPMSDTTLLSSAATECNVLNHTWSQLPYAGSAMLVAAGAYWLSATQQTSVWYIYPMGFALLLGLLFFVGKPSHPSPAEAAGT